MSNSLRIPWHNALHWARKMRVPSAPACFRGVVVAMCFSAIAAKADPAMWVIKDQDSTIYLIGTLHILRPEAVWQSEKVKKATADSTELWLEVSDPDNEAGVVPLIQKYGLDPQKPLSTKLSATQKEKFRKIVSDYNVPLANLEPMKPWLAAVTLVVLPFQKAGYDPKAGVDQALKKQAEKEGDKVRGFETMENQIRMLADLPERDQIALLESALEDVAEGLALVDRLAKAWTEGDMKTISDYLVDELKSEAPGLYEKLFVERNIRWGKKIEEILKGSGVQQIAVGAGHLAGPDSVQTQLTKRGIKVEPY